ncbi:AAEL007938-PA [Aedes aegypti]|uniref:AAEL007938-PA n=2 Tax=Aedes aegypti TaxID=7159 RepID=A0A1S4FI60_AEDAE|nr:chymotrypsin-2 [Aedes aegypti]EAT40329.1 AAEL007938-PA [Aedes aegypti]
MIRLSLLFVLLGAAAVFGGTLSPEFLEWEGRIVGGSNAVSGQFPYQVSLRSSANTHFCGASILNNRYVLTAAHCTQGRTLANTRVVVGTHLLNSGGFAHASSRIIIHPSYNPSTLANDISMVQTTVAIAFNQFAQPIGLSSTFVNTAAGAVVTGWGQLGANAGIPNNLQWLRTDIITLANCRSRHSAANSARVFDNTICTLSPVGRGMCMGDAGGPLVHGGLQHGIVSWGIPCGLGSPDVFARTSSHINWILANAV